MTKVQGQKTFFRTVQSFKSDYAPTKYTQYESQRTGMRVVVSHQEGPKVCGYLVLATEIHDDSGSPHTLEHLCFMGSRNYRYKGFLDKLAARAYSSTNAWTATDHTAYTLDTAGWEGFAQILPVYLEHILFPILSDSAYYTEVHHVDGAGQDAGVVYSEMQGVQNTKEGITERVGQRLVYPEGNGFRYETGGMLENLRVLTNERIRQFHAAMYQPKNLCLVIMGPVDRDHLCRVLDEFESGILKDVPALDQHFTRPWVDSPPTPSFEKTITERVKFPEEDESTGEVQLLFLGPPSASPLDVMAFRILVMYLTWSAASLLPNIIVEKEQLASSVHISTELRPNIQISLIASSVATDKLDFVRDRIISVLQDAASSSIDLKYMRNCIRRWGRGTKLSAENTAETFATKIIEDHLFGPRDGSALHYSLSSLKALDDLEAWTDGQWQTLLSHWLANAHHVAILAEPSAEMAQKVRVDEEKRIKEQQEGLGEDGMKKLAKKLDDAKTENDKPVPPELLDSFEIPSPQSVHFITTVTARSGNAKRADVLENDVQAVVDANANGRPIFIHFEHIPSNFVQVDLLLGREAVKLELKPLVVLFKETFFKSPISRDGARIEFEHVLMEIENDTVSHRIGTGDEYDNKELLRLTFHVEPGNYSTIIKRAKELLFDSIDDHTRLEATLIRLLADIPEEKRDGDNMMSAIMTMTLFKPESSSRAHNTLVRAVYLKRVKALLSRNADELKGLLHDIRRSLFQISNIRAFVVGNIKTLPEPVSAWDVLVAAFPDGDSGEPPKDFKTRKNFLSEIGQRPGKVAHIVPMATLDSSYALFAAKGIDSYADARLPAFLVALAYLDMSEGPMWVSIRGTGLAYGTYFHNLFDCGLLHFCIHRSPDVFKAYDAGRKTVEGYADGSSAFEKGTMEGAVSSIVSQFANEQPTMLDAAKLSFTNQVIRGVSKDWQQQILKQIRTVTEAEIRDVYANIILPVFRPESCALVVTCAKLMSEGLQRNFEEAGFKAEVRTLASFQESYGFHDELGDDDVDGVDDDDDDAEDDDDGESDESEEGGVGGKGRSG